MANLAIIATIRKNNKEAVRVALTEFKGHNLADLRVFAETEDGKTVATSKGLTVNVRLLPELIAALQAADAKARELGLIEKAAKPVRSWGRAAATPGVALTKPPLSRNDGGKPFNDELPPWLAAG